MRARCADFRNRAGYVSAPARRAIAGTLPTRPPEVEGDPVTMRSKSVRSAAAPLVGMAHDY
ncbi:hypothetical protein GCM10010433_17460 [Streptomyces pulveraceus]